MKQFLLTILVLIGLSPAVHAQMKERNAERAGGPWSASSNAAAAESLTRQMTTELRLNESQIIKLRKVNTIKVARTEEIKWQMHEDQPGMQRAMSELQAQYENECGRILTPSQLSELRNRQPVTQPAAPATEGGLG